MKQKRAYDIIIGGATGFMGRLVAEYLFQNYGATGKVNWAMGGRNQTKLEKVRAEVADDNFPLVIADSLKPQYTADLFCTSRTEHPCSQTVIHDAKWFAP